MRKHYSLRVEGEEYKLRLTIRGQRELAEQFQEDAIQTLLAAVTDSRRLCALLTQSLNWEGSGNTITDGEELYDRLVDAGWQGQGRFADLAFEIALASGLLDKKQTGQLRKSVRRAFDRAFDGLEPDLKEEPEQQTAPFPAAD